jgi:hypothetical protein
MPDKETFRIKPLVWKRHGQALFAETGVGTYSVQRIRYTNGELTFRAIFRPVGSRDLVRIGIGSSIHNRVEQCSDDYFSTLSQCLTPVPTAPSIMSTPSITTPGENPNA